MSLAVAIQMDPIEGIDIDGDSTFVLALEAQRRRHEVFHYLPRDLNFAGNRLWARARPLLLRRKKGDYFTLGPCQRLDLGQVDVVLMRQDPPFDMAYITATHLLEQIHPQTLVVNDPFEVRNAPEKLFVSRFPEFTPPTLISTDGKEIAAFRAEHGDIIVKPIYGNGGAGVFHIGPGDGNLNALVEILTEDARQAIIVQAYLAQVQEGDKRIILIDGAAAGAVNRLPPPGEARSNLHIGGKARKSALTARDEEICQAIGPTLKERGLIFAGIDVIGGYLTEINVTSPTCLQEINSFDGVCLEARLWDAIEARL